MSAPNSDGKDTSEAVFPLAEAQEYIALLEDADWQVRLSAVEALAKIRDLQTVVPLLALLKDKKWQVRYGVARALGQTGDLRAVEPLAYSCREWRWRRYDAAIALRLLGGFELPFMILSAVTLSSAQKLNSLQSLIGVEPPVPGFGDPRHRWRAFAIDNVQTFCEAVRDDASTAESIKDEAEAVLTELHNRANVQTLLRASVLEQTQERQELLRGVSGESVTTTPVELLRPSVVAEEQINREKAGILSRIFKRK